MSFFLRSPLAIPLLLALPGAALAAPYTKPAQPIGQYIQSLGFLPPTDPAATLDAHSPEQHAQLEAFLLEGAEAGAMTGDPVLLAWFAAGDASLAPWRLTNCGDKNHDIDYDCPWGTLWQVGLGCQVTYNVNKVSAALSATHPGATAQSVGQAVLDLAAQKKTFPDVDPAALAADPAASTAGMQNAYWLATLMRDMAISAYIEAPPATAWPCYLPGYPGWCAYYRAPANWQAYSDVLSETINSWNQIQGERAAALTPDVIVDDVSSGFTVDGPVTAVGKGGWRGHFVHAQAQAAATLTGTWKAKLAAGTWRVTAFVPYAPDATAPDARVTVKASDGPHEVILDQSQTGGRFFPIGEYHFDEGEAEVRMTNAASSGEVGWDAVRFHAIALDVISPSSSASSGGGAGGAAGSSGAGMQGAGGSGAGASGAGAGSAGASADPESSGGCALQPMGLARGGAFAMIAAALLARSRRRARSLGR